MNNRNTTAEGLSPHLFWDMDKDTLDWDKSASLIVKRVLEYGLWDDWKIIYKKYGMEFIVMKAKNLRELEPRALNFIATVSNVPINSFRCCTTTRLKNPHWNF